MFCRSLFVLLYFLCWPLYCVSFNWRLLLIHPFGIFKLFLYALFSLSDRINSLSTSNTKILRVRVMVFNVTFNNISAISWRSILLAKETGVLVENHHRPQVTDKLYHIGYISPWAGFELTILVAISTGYTGSCRSNYSTMTIMTAPIIV
jgi:hypothetical protein